MQNEAKKPILDEFASDCTPAVSCFGRSARNHCCDCSKQKHLLEKWELLNCHQYSRHKLIAKQHTFLHPISLLPSSLPVFVWEAVFFPCFYPAEWNQNQVHISITERQRKFLPPAPSTTWHFKINCIGEFYRATIARFYEVPCFLRLKISNESQKLKV